MDGRITRDEIRQMRKSLMYVGAGRHVRSTDIHGIQTDGNRSAPNANLLAFVASSYYRHISMTGSGNSKGKRWVTRCEFGGAVLFCRLYSGVCMLCLTLPYIVDSPITAYEA